MKWLPGRSGRQGKIILAQGIANAGAAVLAESLSFYMVVMQKVLVDRRGHNAWAQIAAAAIDWADASNVPLRDAVFLVPQTALLKPAREAWGAASGRWMPRIETPASFARSVAPAIELSDFDIRFDAALDRLTAQRWMRSAPDFAALRRDDPLAFDDFTGLLQQAAVSLARAVAGVAPSARPAHWAACREALRATRRTNPMERRLGLMALEWAAAGSRHDTDILFELKPAAWLAVRCGGGDPLIDGLLAHVEADAPTLCLDIDPGDADPIGAAALHCSALIAVCSGFENEAQRAAAQVLADLRDLGGPVALVAEDRLLVRRVQALLARTGVPLRDETGWTLSTTRAGATVIQLLRAASASATSDDVLDAIKSWPLSGERRWGLAALEAGLRRRPWASLAEVDLRRAGPAANALWAHSLGTLEPLRRPSSALASVWCNALREVLRQTALDASLRADAAGQQVLAVLHLGATDEPLSDHVDLTLSEYSRWIQMVLEEATFIAPATAAPQVIVTPAARLVMRPWAAIVWPGADEAHLGVTPPPHPLFSEADLTTLSLPTPAQRRDREGLILAHALSSAKVTFLHRTDDGRDPVARSSWLAQIDAARLRQRLAPLAAAPDERVQTRVDALPASRPLPIAAILLPERLSASACEDLRACPYRFFARHMLALRDVDELDGGIEKREFGLWLHATLHRFHRAREVDAGPDHDAVRLADAASEAQHEMGLSDADLLPYTASFASFVPMYLAWQRLRDAAGVHWSDGELRWGAEPPAWGGVLMHGIVDRIDRELQHSPPRWHLVDYKTGSSDALKKKLSNPLEDTQLAFYAALCLAQPEGTDISPGALVALYVALDNPKGIVEVTHPEVTTSAAALIEGIGGELSRLRAGAPLPALGEGEACTHCDARGLCRRDQWPARQGGLLGAQAGS